MGKVVNKDFKEGDKPLTGTFFGTPEKDALKKGKARKGSSWWGTLGKDEKDD